MTTTLNHHTFNTPSSPTIHHRRVTLIKRPPLVRSSSPTLNNNNNSVRHNNNNRKPKKSVRFCDNDSLENVRLFLKTQMPKACQSDPACSKQYSYRLRKPNWPSEQHYRMGAIRIENIQLDTKKKENLITLVGTCQVANLAFEKHISIRYSFDDWTTIQQVDAQYQEPIANSANTWDRFNFKISAPPPSSHHILYLAAKYTVNGREFWDNNDHKNYQVDIISDVQLDLQLDDISSSSDDEEEDNEENTFEDCVHEEEELVEQLKPLTLSNTTTSFGHRYDFNSSTIDKPWTPPLSPTTPVDHSPLWAPSSSKEYFNNTTEYNDIIHKYSYYTDHRKPTFFTQQYPPRCSSPKVIHS